MENGYSWTAAERAAMRGEVLPSERTAKMPTKDELREERGLKRATEIELAPVPRALKRLEGTLDLQFEIQATLRSKLDAVLGPEGPQPEELDPRNLDAREQSGLAEHLNLLADRLQSANHQLNLLIERVEL